MYDIAAVFVEKIIKCKAFAIELELDSTIPNFLCLMNLFMN